MAKRDWIIRNDEQYETEEDFRSAVMAELAGFENIGHRTGMGIVAQPARRRNQRGEIETLAWVFETATVPLLPDDAARDDSMDALVAEPQDDAEEDVIVMVAPNGEIREVPESGVSELMEQGWAAEGLPEEEPQDFPEPAVVGEDKYAD